MSVNFSDCMSSLENGPGGEPVWTIVQSDDPKNRPGNYWALCSESVLGDPSSTCSIDNMMFQADKNTDQLDNVYCKNDLTTNNVPTYQSTCGTVYPGCGIDYTQPADLIQFSKVRDYSEDYRAPCCRPTQYVNLSTTWGGQKPYSL